MPPITAWVTLLVTGLIPRSNSPEPALWFALEPGPHAVGFQSLWETDAGRRYVTAFDDGATYGAGGNAPRPVLINLWYPAVEEDTECMPYAAYFDLAPDREELVAFADALSAYAEGVVIGELFDRQPAELDENERVLWERLLHTPTACHRDAEPAPGPFPLVVYHSGAGSSYEDSATLCEWLASHGYVVVSSAYPRADGSSLNIDGGDGSIADMQWLVRFAARLDFVDCQRVAIGGHSAGAQACLLFAARPDCVADAVVLLDTTQDYYSLGIPTYRALVDEVLDHVEAFTEPMLVMAGPSAMFALIDRLERADRTYLTIPDLGHNEFISQGLQRLLVMQWRAELDGSGRSNQELAHRGRTQERFRLVCQALRAFLDAALGKDAAALDALRDELAGTDLATAPHAARAPIGTCEAPPYDLDGDTPPTPRQFRRLLREAGMDQTCEVLRRFRDRPTEVALFEDSMATGSTVLDLLLDGRTEDAVILCDGLRELGRDPVPLIGFLAQMAHLSKRTELERLYLKAAVQLAPDDEDLTRRLQALETGEN